jgi:hypothetical protein
MEFFKKTSLYLCVLFLTVSQGCVKNDLEDCPDAIRYALAFKYTLHTDEGKDRFYKDVDKMFVYVFDVATGLCVYADTVTLIAPFKEDYTYPLSLNVGKYNIITWGWGRNDGDNMLKISTAVVPAIIPGETSIDEARLLLEEKICDGRLEKTFYGEIRDVNVPAFISRVDTISLMNLTNQIRIIIEDAVTAKLQDDISISIVGDNGAYYFNSSDNAPDRDPVKGRVTYLPYKIYRTDSILVADPIYVESVYPGTGLDSMLIVEISTLRLIQNNDNMQLVIKNGNNYERRFLLLNILQGLTPPIQYNLDKYYRWQLSYNILNTYSSIEVWVMNWHFIILPSDIGGLYD